MESAAQGSHEEIPHYDTVTAFLHAKAQQLRTLAREKEQRIAQQDQSSAQATARDMATIIAGLRTEIDEQCTEQPSWVVLEALTEYSNRAHTSLRNGYLYVPYTLFEQDNPDTPSPLEALGLEPSNLYLEVAPDIPNL